MAGVVVCLSAKRGNQENQPQDPPSQTEGGAPEASEEGSLTALGMTVVITF